jgi:hypothetical protein
MSQQSEMASVVYSRLGKGPVPAAHLVRELRATWGPAHGVSEVHGFVREVATCLLHHADVQVGDMKEGVFVPWNIPAWDADEKIDSEMMAMEHYLEDEARYVFGKEN